MSQSDGKGNIPELYSVFNGEVASLQTYGAFIKIPGCKKQGLVHKSQMSSARIEDPSEMLAKGEKVYCKVIGMEGEGEKISLSMKVVNQTTGQDLDPNNVQLDQDAKKRRQWQHIGKDKIELGAELNTTCRRCGGHGHLTIDCFAGKDGTQYDLIPDLETLTALPLVSDLSHSHHKKKKKKKEKKKKKKSKKRKQSTSSSASSDSDDSNDSNTSDDDDDAGYRGKKKQDTHSHRKKQSKVSHEDDLRQRKRMTSDKQSRLSGPSFKHKHNDKRERGGSSSDRSGKSSSSSPHQHRKRDGSMDLTRSSRDVMKSHSSRFHDKREIDRRRENHRKDRSNDSASDDSSVNEYQHGRSRAEGQVKTLAPASGRDSQGHHHLHNKHHREEQTRHRGRRRFSSHDEERIRDGGKGQRGHTDSGSTNRARASRERDSQEKDYMKNREGDKYRKLEKKIDRSEIAEQRFVHDRERHKRQSRSRERERNEKKHKRRSRSSS